VPTFYDSIEIARDHALAKFRRRAERSNVLLAFALTLAEAVATLLLGRFVFRTVMSGGRWAAARRAAAR